MIFTVRLENYMKLKAKKLFTLVLCLAVIFTAIPLSAFATDTTEYYCEIVLKKGCKDNLKPGETTEVYLDYYVGENKDINILWSTPGNMCEYEYVTDNETGLATGMKITAVSGGMFYVFVSILDSNGNELAKDHIEIWSSEPDSKPLNEKIDEFIDMLPANLGFLGYVLAYAVSVIAVGQVTGILETCIVIYNRLNEFVELITNLEYRS